MATSQHIDRLADDAEEVASALQYIREPASADAASITEAVAKLFGVSTVLQRLATVLTLPQYEHSLYRIQRDIQLVYRSLQYTLNVALDVMRHSRESAQSMVWGDLVHRMSGIERVGFSERLRWYQSLIQILLNQLDGDTGNGMTRLREDVQRLLESQDNVNLVGPAARYVDSTTSTPRPAVQAVQAVPAISWRPLQHRPRQPSSDLSDSGRPTAALPRAPEPPIVVSPTLSSSQTLVSSHTYYSSDDQSVYHWARDVLMGLDSRIRSTFRANQQVCASLQLSITMYKLMQSRQIETDCMGTPQPAAQHSLFDEGFDTVAEIKFTDTDTIVTLHWRPSDNRSRILISTLDNRGREEQYCVPLTSLIALRERSSLTLCRVSSRSGALVCWAKLRFIHYERMVLFYSTFVAMKCQDQHGTPLELVEPPGHLNEVLLYSSVIRDGEMRHALRLYKEGDAGPAGVYRLEASPLRGASVGVPIWTAFLTKYVEARDQEWFGFERNSSRVMMCCPKPEPFVFFPGYSLPMTRGGEYVLEFESRGEASNFKVEWNRLCSAGRR